MAQIYLACHADDETPDLEAVIQHKVANYFGAPKDTLHDIYLAYPSSMPDKTLGYISVIRNTPDLPGGASEVDSVYVGPESQKQGIGSQLLKRVRKDNQCESWVRCDRGAQESIDWFIKKGYKYHHTEIGQYGMLSVLCWPGNM